MELSRGMSALCQKRTFCAAERTSLFDHLVGSGKERWCHGDAERLRSFQIDRQLKFIWVLNRHVGRLGGKGRGSGIEQDRSADVRFGSKADIREGPHHVP